MDDVKVAGWLGIDVGWVHPAVDSEGQIFSWATRRQRRDARGLHTAAGDVTITRPDGTTETRPAYSDDLLATLVLTANDELRMRCRGLASTIVSKAFARCYGVALESWADDPNRNARWRVIHKEIIDKCEERGVPWRAVRRAYTSQTCPECGHCDEGNRPSRNKFTCLACGHEGHADRVAAINIAARAAKSIPPDPSVPVPGTLEKRCSKCLKVKPRQEFNRQRQTPDGRSARCRFCQHPNSTGEACPAVTVAGDPCKNRGVTFYDGYCGRHVKFSEAA